MKNTRNLRKIVNSRPDTAIVYLRVSSDTQEKSGLGLEAQSTLCRESAERLGIEILTEYSETVSGKIHPEHRSVFMKALQHAQETGALLMVAKLDRFSREVFHVAGYTQHHFFDDLTPDLFIADSPRMSQLEIYIKSMLAEEERKMISKRTKEALAEKKKQGVKLGAVGQQAHFERIRVTTEQAMKLAQEMRTSGYSYHRIADELNQQGFTTSKGGSWYAANVRDRLNTLARKL